MLKRPIVIISVIVLIGAAVYAVKKLMPTFTVTVPEYREPGELVQVNQGWTDAERLQFHHTAQGTRLVPYAWFKVLEQPCFSLSGCEEFRNLHYLSRFGFLASKADPKLNPDGLPVGFSYQENFYDPISQRSYPALGLTCAACHTGELHYGKYAVRIDGAPAMIEVTQFQKALGLALAFTQMIPFRYGRFERNVLGPDATEEQKTALKQSLAVFMEAAKAEIKATEERKVYANQAGFARTDALTRIGNQVFAVDMKNNDNFAMSNAPVRFPQIWDASWFTWVQYNSSISDPMVRNIGEALGVRAVAKLYGPTAGDFENSVSVEGLRAVEELLSGPAPYKGLSSPKWPSVFPALDQAKVTKGAALYKQNCVSCHLPPVEELIADLNSAEPRYWWKNSLGKRFLTVTDVRIEDVGTDPHEAQDFIDRKADTGDLKKGRVSAAEGLDLVTKAIGTKYYDKMGFSPDKRNEWNGFHAASDPAVRAIPVYKARPLNGIWAVAPYLHNGSVPNLYLLLSPKTERPDTFWLGSKQFDPVKVGYDTSEIKGGYLLETKNTGNANTGHEFKDGPRGNGVIGSSLSPDDRWALIEYLKSM
jgi:hypothetical protein